MAGPITIVKPEWDLDRQLAEKHFRQLQREKTPPFPDEETEERHQKMMEKAERLRKRRLQEVREKEALDRRLRERRAWQTRQNNAQMRRSIRRKQFMEDFWLRFKIGFFGLFGVSPFQVIWDHRHG